MRVRERIRRSEGREVRHIERQRIASAHRHPSTTEPGPGETKVRRKILVIDIVNAADAIPHLHQTTPWYEVGFPIRGVAHGAVDFPAQPVTERQSRFDFPIVLRVETDGD